MFTACLKSICNTTERERHSKGKKDTVIISGLENRRVKEECVCDREHLGGPLWAHSAGMSNPLVLLGEVVR